MCLGLSTAPNDYISLSEEIIFQPGPGPRTICRPVSIEDDVVIEAEEMFLIILNTSDTRVSLTVENSRASIFITDNDNGIYG